MIKPEMAQKFIDEIVEYTEYNINIMDESGVIIASRDKHRIGTYHEAAARILRGGPECIVVEDDRTFPGVLPGINMAIVDGGRREGVVGVTGDPAHIREVAMVTRLAIEAMLKYEKQQERILLRQGRKETFLYLLTHAENANPAELRAAAAKLEYDESITRIPILCRILDNTPPEQVLQSIKTNEGHCEQDLSGTLDDSHVLVFRTLKEKNTASVFSYREEILSYLEQTLRWMKRADVRAVFYVGSAQRAFTQYIHAYRHCLWLEARAAEPVFHGGVPAADPGLPSAGKAGKAGEAGKAGKAGKAGDRVVFFRDHIAAYFYSVLPREELHRVFYHYRHQLQGEDRQQFKELACALIETNFNLTEAAKRLYIHKNTLMYRYNKVKDLFGIDPVRNASDRTFLTLLYYSL